MRENTSVPGANMSLKCKLILNSFTLFLSLQHAPHLKNVTLTNSLAFQMVVSSVSLSDLVLDGVF